VIVKQIFYKRSSNYYLENITGRKPATVECARERALNCREAGSERAVESVAARDEHSCTLPECMNRVRTNLVRVAPSKLIHGEAGLFACEDIEEGTVVACFGAVRQLRETEEGTRTRLGYSFIVKEREGKSLTITPKHGVTEGCMAHAINHTCHPGFANCRFVHAGIVGGWSEDEQGGIGGRRTSEVGWSEDEQGGIGGRRTSQVFVKTTKRVESDTELFANYGTKFRFPGGCVCHLCRPLEA
jgi:hypothetical protein